MTIENILVEEYRKILKDDLELQINYISTVVAEDYAERVGLIRGLRQSLDSFDRLVKQHLSY